MKLRITFPFVQQHEAMDCGPACLSMISKYHGYSFPLSWLRDKAHIDREGVSLAGIAQAAEDIGFRSLPVKLPFSKTDTKPGLNQAPLPAILHWNQKHFVVVYHIGKSKVYIADPSAGKVTLGIHEFKKHWIQDGDEGIAMLFEPGVDIGKYESEANSKGLANQEDEKLSFFTFLTQYFTPYTRLFSQLGIGLVVGAVLALIIPFVTQAIVDVGINGSDRNFLLLVLLGQFVLVVGQTAIQFIQNQILLHIGGRINIALISDFLGRLMRLPLAYFDVKNEGDLMARVGDHQRIQQFLTRNSLAILFALFNFLVLGSVLLVYDSSIFFVFFVAALLYAGWIWLFLSKRKKIDYQLFHIAGQNHNNLTELVRGMSEIKLQNSQNKRKWLWANIQARLFKVQMQSLMITQYQDLGSLLINRLRDIIITFVTATLVINGKLTLGSMLAIQYIVGQLNAPLEQFIQFIRTAQDARLSWDRVSEVHYATPEELPYIDYIDTIPDGDLILKQISHRYNELNQYVLEDIDLEIPRGKVTAIVGASGSGKTTLLKLIQGFYKPSKGEIYLGATPLQSVRPSTWRKYCGSVAQDGFIFSGTIRENIGESDVIVDNKKLYQALHIANVKDFVAGLPLGVNTKIGAGGNGISSGQRQRLLIARAVYKNPEFLFFDEATNALDAKNESVIVRNLEAFYKNKTVLIVAHRLSTVVNADNIIVLDEGRVVEQGTHNGLVALEGSYFHLIKNQLELGL